MSYPGYSSIFTNNNIVINFIYIASISLIVLGALQYQEKYIKAIKDLTTSI